MEDENGKITFAATGPTLEKQQLLSNTLNEIYSFPHHREPNDLKGGFAPEFRAKIHDMGNLIDRETIKTDTDKGNERYKVER